MMGACARLAGAAPDSDGVSPSFSTAPATSSSRGVKFSGGPQARVRGAGGPRARGRPADGEDTPLGVSSKELGIQPVRESQPSAADPAEQPLMPDTQVTTASWDHLDRFIQFS